MHRYAQMVENLNTTVAEENSSYYIITERHAQVLWLEQKYFTTLQTADGETITVISPGIWNSEAGPDFKKAHLRIGNLDYIGDVEIHLSDEGWTQHRHHEDPNYNQVILHLSFWRSGKPRQIVTQSGKEVIKAYFEGHLKISERRITQLIDLELYPYTKFTGGGYCANALFKRLSPEKTISFFQSAAEWRLTKKRRHLHVRIEDPRLYMSGGIVLALGYKHNSETFLELFLRLRQHASMGYDQLLAMAMDQTGLFAAHHTEKWNASDYFRHLTDKLKELPACPHPKFELKLSKIRPYNHPVRRLAYLVHLIKDPSVPQLYQRMEAHWEASWPLINGKKDYKMLTDELLNLIPDYSNDYWNHHYTFEPVPKIEFLPLIGETLKKEILINTFLPLLQESISSRGILKELERFSELFNSMPTQVTGKVKYLNQRFFGENPKLNILKKAAVAQGAYQVHHDFCLHYESSCVGCPFVERFKNFY